MAKKGNWFARNRRKALISLTLTFFCAIWLVPLLFGFFTTFKDSYDVLAYPVKRNLLPERWTMQNYIESWNYGAAPFPNMVKNSLIVSLSCVVLTVFNTSTSAYAYERLEFKGREILFWSLMGLNMIPGVVGIVTSYSLFKKLNLLNTYGCLILGNVASVWSIFLLRNFMTGIPKEIDEAARIDGANDFMIYARIILPSMYPALVVVAMGSFTGSWNDLLWPVLTIYSPKMLPLTAGIRQVANTYGDANYERVLASCWLAMIPSLIVYFIGRKYFLNGLQLTAAVKG